MDHFTVEGFKHIQVECVDGFLSGRSIQIGLHQMYRAMESDRGDPLEGVAEYKVDRLEPAHEFLPEYADARAAVGYPEPRPGLQNLVFQDNTIRYVAPPAYVFCCSSEPDFPRVQEKGEAIVRIKNLRPFAAMLRSAAPLVLGPERVGAVKYEPRSVNPFRQGLLGVDPFLKSEQFSFEQELRITWPADSEAEGYVRVSAPLASVLLERIA